MRKLLTVLSSLSLILIVTACCGGGESTTSGGDSAGDSAGAEKGADGFVDVPNSKGLKAKVPDNATPNGIGGAAGFHTDDKSFGFMLDKVEGEKTMEQAKASAEEIFFKEWIGEGEKTEDGWVLTWKVAQMDFAGEEPKETGVLYSFEVVKKVDGTTYNCHGAVKDEAGMKAAVESCKSVKK